MEVMTRRPRVEQQTAQGEWLKRRAGQLGLVQADIVRQMKERGAKVERSMVSNWFNDHSRIGPKHIDALAEILNTKPGVAPPTRTSADRRLAAPSGSSEGHRQGQLADAAHRGTRLAPSPHRHDVGGPGWCE